METRNIGMTATHLQTYFFSVYHLRLLPLIILLFQHEKKLSNKVYIASNERWEPGLLSRYSDWLRAGRQRGRSSSPGGVKNLHFAMSSRSTLGSNSMDTGGSFSAGGVKLTTHLQIVPRSIKLGFIHPLPHTPASRSA
jgi:hypothetical protein